jgi:DNA-binding transcriptional ArsR family regulator
VFENSPVLDLTIGRSSVRQRILALLMSVPGGRLHLREIQRRASTSPGTASRELAKLVSAGLVDREAEGNQVYFRVSSSPFATLLRTLLVAIPEPGVGPRPPRLPRAKSGPPSAAAGTAGPTPSETPAPQPAPVTVEPEQSTGFATESARAAVDLGSEDASAEEPLPAAPSRIIRPVPPRQVADAAPGSARGTGPTATAGADSTAVPTASAAASPRPTVIRASAGSSMPSGASPAATRAAIPDPLGLQVAGRLAENVRSMYREAVRGIYLYGARAGGPAPDADVETIIVLDHVDQYGAELERTSHLCAELSHELDVVVSRIFVTETDWNGGSEGTPPQIRAGAVAV